jgi:hypothetical protein
MMKRQKKQEQKTAKGKKHKQPFGKGKKGKKTKEETQMEENE